MESRSLLYGSTTSVNLETGGKPKTGHQGTSSTLSTLFNFLSLTIGTGLLSLPGAAGDGGWAAVGVIIAVAVVANHTAKLLILCLDAVEDPQERTYMGVGRAVFGWWGGVVVGVLQMVLLAGACVVYLVLLSNFLGTILWCTNPHYYIIGFTAFLIPASWLRTLSEVAIVSYAGLSASILTWIIVVWYGMDRGIKDPVAGDRELVIVANGASTFNLIGFAFSGHSTLPTIYETMATPKQANLMLNIGFSFIAFVYATTTASAYFGYGPDIGGPNNNVFYSLPTVWPVEMAGGALAAHLCCAFLLPFNPVALQLEHMIYGPAADGHPGAPQLVRRIPVRTILVLCIGAVALAVPYFGQLVSLFGAFSVMSMVFVFPPIFFYRLYPERRNGPYTVVLAIIVLLGVAGTVIGLIYAVDGLVSAIREGGDVYRHFFSHKCALN